MSRKILERLTLEIRMFRATGQQTWSAFGSVCHHEHRPHRLRIARAIPKFQRKVRQWQPAAAIGVL